LKIRLIIFFTFFIYKINNAQNTKIIGKIISLNDNKPIQGAVIKYGKIGSLSDKNGFFTLHIIDYTDKLSVNVSAIGYKKKTIVNFKLNELIEINLEDSISNLPNVTIASGTNALIKKAIENISQNYRQKSFKQTGILRLFFNLDNGYHYENDAIIENLIPPYNSHDEISVRLKGNKSSLYYDTDSNNIHVLNWVRAYKIVANQDIVHRPYNFLNPKKLSSYEYKLIDKYSIGNDRFYVIEFSSKFGIKGVNYKKVYGKLLIDSASLAFVKADLVYDDINDPSYVEINNYYLTIEYKKIQNLWYLDKIHSEATFKKTNNIISNSKIFYIATENDTNYQKDFTYLEKIQNSDITQKLNIPVKKDDSLSFIKLFKTAEEDSLITLKEKYYRDTKQNKISKDTLRQYIPFFKKINLKLKKYFFDGGVTNGLNAYKTPFKIEKNNSNFSTTGNNTIGLSLKLRIYHYLFYLLDTYSYTNTIQPRNNENTGSHSLKYEFDFTFANRIFTFSPILGFNKIKISNYTSTLNKTIYNYHYGFSQEYELTHKLRLQFSSTYNINYKSTGNKLDFITPMPYSYSFGINMKL